jgi:hypothetical protein
VVGEGIMKKEIVMVSSCFFFPSQVVLVNQELVSRGLAEWMEHVEA